MQRALAPKSQVTEVARFVRQCGGEVKHADVLEFVAHLNGAANWNALTKTGKQADQQVTPEAAPQRPGEREVDKNATKVIFISATMFDESEPWFLANSLGTHPETGAPEFQNDRELEEDELKAIQEQGIVVGALVCYPRADQWGLPDVAIRLGMLDWLYVEQSMSTCKASEFELYPEDMGDDSPTVCVLTVRIPKTFNIQ